VPLGPTDLVLCSGTLPRLVPFRERLEAALAGGFSGISLWGRDYWAARREGFSDADMFGLLNDYGLTVAEIDPAWWWLPGAAEITISEEFDDEEVFRYPEAEMLRIGEAVGARSLNAVDVFGGSWTAEQAAESFAVLCDRASDHGMLVHIEALPWSRIRDVATAWEIARLADRTNGGVAVDAWHYFRAGADEAGLRSVPGDRVLGVQLDDGPTNPETNLIEATLHDRLLPGEGEFDLPSLLRALTDIGSVAPIGVEVFSDALHELAPAEAAHRAGAATRRVLDASR
jgi:sugar phosphate isomerase/epimerase